MIPGMNLKFIIWILLTLTSSSLFGQTIKKCDGTVLSYTSDRIGKLNQEEIRDFLLTFGKECRNNVEYSEWSNELLFDVLDKQTELTLRTIQKEKSKIDLDEILDVISSPLLDENIDKLIEKVKGTKADTKLKQTILDKLTIAQESYKN
jgi:hypothetical protein